MSINTFQRFHFGFVKSSKSVFWRNYGGFQRYLMRSSVHSSTRKLFLPSQMEFGFFSIVFHFEKKYPRASQAPTHSFRWFSFVIPFSILIEKWKNNFSSNEEETKDMASLSFLEELDSPECSQTLINEPNSGLISLKVMLRLTHLWILCIPVLITFPLAILGSSILSNCWWWILLKALETGGPCWIKLGQWMSTRPDLFSEEFCERMSKLHSTCPTHSWRSTKEIVESSLGRKISLVFSDFDSEPIASGAIAQVYKATLLDGTKVAVKVRHPHAETSVLLDLKILAFFIRQINRIPNLKFMSLVDAVEQFTGTMLAQLDLRRETLHLLHFRMNFKYWRSVGFPRPIPALCSASLLVETFEDGEPISRFLPSKSNESLQQLQPDMKLFRRQLAEIGMAAYLKMMLWDHYVHADLHPGNILVRKQANPIEDKHFFQWIPSESIIPTSLEDDWVQFSPLWRSLLSTSDVSMDSGIQLVFLDVGLITKMSAQDSTNFVELFKAVIQGNGERGAQLMIERAREKPHFESLESEEKFKKEMKELFSSIRKKKLAELEVGSFLKNVLNIMQTYHVTIEGNFATLVLGTIVLEGLGRRLDPDMNLLEASIPFLFRCSFLNDEITSFV